MKSQSESSYRQTWWLSLGVATVVHVAMIGSLFVRWTPAADRSPEMAAIAIEMAELAAPPAVVHDTPTPRQVEAPVPKPLPREDSRSKTLPFEPPPPQAIPDRAEVVLQAKKEDAPEKQVTQQLPPALTTTELAAPDLKPAERATALNVNGATVGKATPADLWDARVLARIELTKRYPRSAAQSGQQDDVDVMMVVDRDGNLLDAKVRGSKGFSVLDEAAMDAVRRATPFPRPPKEVEGDRIRVSVIVRFFKKT